MFSLKQRYVMALAVSAAVFGLAVTSYADDPKVSLTDGGRDLMQDPDVSPRGGQTSLHILNDTSVPTRSDGQILGAISNRVLVSDGPIYVDTDVTIGYFHINGNYDFSGTLTYNGGDGENAGIYLWGNSNCSFDKIILRGGNHTNMKRILVEGTGSMYVGVLENPCQGGVMKQGTGLLRIDTIPATGTGNPASPAFDVQAGTLLLTGDCYMSSANYRPFNFTEIGRRISYANLVVGKDAVLAGSGTIFSTGNANRFVYIDGGVAPGNYGFIDGLEAGDPGAVGAFTIKDTPSIYFSTNSHIDLDFASSTLYDQLVFDNGAGAGPNVNIVGLTINLNAIGGFVDGDYDIIVGAGAFRSGELTFTQSGDFWNPSLSDAVPFDVNDIKFNVFVDGEQVGSNIADNDFFGLDFGKSFVFGIDADSGNLTLTIKEGGPIVPEPASLGLLGLGVGVLMLRRKRS